VVNDYDSFAEAYSAGNEASLINGYYTRPAVLDLAGDVAGRRILDAGCGSGPVSAALRDRGATMTGFDSSAKMLELARRRIGPGEDLHLAALCSRMPFPKPTFNNRHRMPVLHCLQDWTAPLAAGRAEARRTADRGRRPSLRSRPPAARGRARA
jgi:ubiquinone/menaquinone biosynthesis C-methylase UbiE